MKFPRKAAVVVAAIASLGSAKPMGWDILEDARGVGRPAPRPVILMFWATWCAPCRLELEALPELSAAARPIPIVVTPFDESNRTREALRGLAPSRVGYPAIGAQALLNALIGGAAGLPVNIAIDASGAICARKLGPLTIADAQDWTTRCARPRPAASPSP